MWRSGKIESITLRCSQTINAIRVNYTTKEESFMIGNIENGMERDFVLESDEYITSVNGRAGDTQIDAIQFTTNTGRKSGWYGGYGGIVFHMENNAKPLRSIKGSGNGGQLDCLFFIFEK